MFHRKTLPAALLLAFSPLALAQSQETELEPVIVTANRVARTADETLAPVSVLTRKDIERLQANSVPDLLRGLPGVQLANSGGPGKLTSLYLRGTNDSHVLVLVDGVKIGSATAGNAALQDLPVEQIERIELVRGPRASLYGSEAIGGVIQIFTKRGVQDPAFSLGAGSRGTSEGSASGGFGSADSWLNLGVSGLTTRGINVANGSEQASYVTPESDRDGYTRSTMNLRGGGRFGERLDFDLQALHTEGRNKYDASYAGEPDVSDLQQDIYAGNLRYVASERYTTRLKLAQSLDASRNFAGEKFVSRFDTRRSQASWQHEVSLAKGHQLVAGFDHQYDEVMSSAAYDRNNRTNQAVFTQYLADLGPFDLQLAGRHDKNEQFGHHNTGSVAAGYTFSPALRLRASHGTAFKAPTFNDLYYPGGGNPALKPESSRSSELGASGKAAGLDWQASLFRTEVNDLIAWAPTAPGSWVWTPSNVDRARIKGLELGASRHFGKTRLAASATFLDPKNRSGSDNDGKLLAHRARQSGRLDADHELGRWSFGASLTGVGTRYDDSANSTKLGGYTTVDVRAEYAFSPAWRLQTRIENALDKRYETAYGYNQPGIGAYLTLRYTPR